MTEPERRIAPVEDGGSCLYDCGASAGVMDVRASPGYCQAGASVPPLVAEAVSRRSAAMLTDLQALGAEKSFEAVVHPGPTPDGRLPFRPDASPEMLEGTAVR